MNLPIKPQVIQTLKHIEIIGLYDDNFAEKVGDISMGFLHCKHCDVLQPYLFKLPPKEHEHCPICKGECSKDEHESARYVVQNGESEEAVKLKRGFVIKHHHGDGMLLLGL